MNFCPFGTFPYSIQFGDTLWILAKRFNTTVDAIIMANPQINPENLSIGQLICIPQGNNTYSNVHLNRDNTNYIELSNRIRILWEQHIAWTRMTIVDIVYNLPEIDFAIKRLLRNPADFADLLRPLYGDDVANRFKTLLTDHLVIASEIVKAAKAGNSIKAEKDEKRWYQNADDIANLLASINPYWPQDEWRRMLYDHLDLVKSEALFFLGNEFERNTLLYDEMERQAMEMADLMVNGIIKQFPNKFYSKRIRREY